MPHLVLRTATTLIAAAALSTLPLAAKGEESPLKPTAEQARFFELKIRPILVEQCQKCHGGTKSKGGLRLDTRGNLLAGGDTGPAVVAGKPEESLLILAVKYDEDGPKMPPAKKLPPAQVEAFAEWVKMGAPWPGDSGATASSGSTSGTRKGKFTITDKDRSHWAFLPLKRPATPVVNGLVANPIDAFVLAGLDSKGLKPNPPAGKIELIRRATYDLTGLPPTIAEVDAFLKDSRPDAYEAVVDRLLASPRYGEKWARHWLDLVRFAETNSYERDGAKPSAWRFRDYVIQSLNADKPYDRFIREQLAGDELADANAESITGTGFYRLGIWDDEPVDREQARFDAYDDIVATTSQVFLGLTVDCARCHDHKLDPIPQKDYYRLVSFFRNINHFRNGGPTDELAIGSKPGEASSGELAKVLKEKQSATQKTISGIEGEFIKRFGNSGSVEIRRRDITDLKYKFYRDTWDRLPDFASIKFESSGNLPEGLFDLAPRTRDDAFGFVFEGILDVPQDAEYTFYLDSDDGARLLVGGDVAVAYDGIHTLGKEQSALVGVHSGRVPIRLEYFQKSAGQGLKVAWSGPGFERRPLSVGERSKESIDVRSAINQHGDKVLGADLVERYKQARKLLEELRRKKVAGDTILRVTEVGDRPPPTFVMARGNPHIPGDQVEPAFIEVLGSPAPIIPQPPVGAKTSGRRKVLADWIASPANPLTSRVMVNRLFQHHFGRGIARSPNNFGLQGDKPTHPELLDWLASELIAEGWRLKPIHRVIMTSNAYRMASRTNVEAASKDPVNDLLWRFDPRRLSAEEIRDSILAVDGSLNLKMGGPGVYPEIPEEVLAGQSVPGQGWGRSSPQEQARRSIYIHVKRSLLMPMLEGFDLAETDRSTPTRFSTTQPTQALAMLNSSFLKKKSAALAIRLRSEAGPETAAQVRLALKLTTSREPGDTEVRRGTTLIAELQKRDGLAAEAALDDFCLLVLNLNEFVYLD